ncbi:hypothetical protein MMC17_001246 [Xylographa soralifera]|nr:hypothetical protein [Xylographa soralifera]
MDDIKKLKEALPNELLVEDRLCSGCSTIDFEEALHPDCHLHYRRAIDLGPLQEILTNTISCPVCRLVSSCISSYGGTILPNSNLRIVPRNYAFQNRDKPVGSDKNLEPLYMAGGSAKWLEIVSCLHSIKPTHGNWQNIGTPCEFSGIGALLLAEPKYHRKDGEVFSLEWNARDLYARDVSPVVDITLIRQWMSYCAIHHTEICGTPFLNLQPRKHIRLIDVQQKQLVIGDLDSKYMALSYVWGSGTKPVLTKSSLEQHLRPGGLTRNEIPLTIWDTMDLTVGLGERYLWVDSICVIQDDPLDKLQMLPMMGEIYNHAMLVIIAAVESAHTGLPGRGERKRQWNRPTEIIQGLSLTTGQPELQCKLDTTKWNTRAWTYQEGQLARRALIFTDHQVYWSCRKEAWCEDRFTEFQNVCHSPGSQNSLFSPAKNLGEDIQINDFFIRTVGSICHVWEYCQKVDTFSTRDLSTSDDTFWAFLGVLKSLLPKFPEGYIWGMPKNCLDAALLWETNHWIKKCHSLVVPTKTRGWQELEIPSWSWIGQSSKVWYSGCSVKSMVEWQEPVQYGGDYEEQKDRYEGSEIFVVRPDLTGPALSEFVRLQCNAQTTTLKVHTPMTTKAIDICRFNMISATVSQQSGKDIGSIKVPAQIFEDSTTIEGQFILLSSKVEDICVRSFRPHDQRTEEFQQSLERKEPEYNIMLILPIGSSDDKKVAYRVGWMTIAKSAWEECETRTERFILG